MIELRQAEKGLLNQSFAGDVFNTAVYFHRELPVFETCFVSSVGPDGLSKTLLEYAAEQGLKTELITSNAAQLPGIYWIEIDSSGERSFFYWRKDSAATQMLDIAHFDVLRRRISQCGLMYFSGITLAILDDAKRERLLALATLIKNAGGWVGFDSNYRPSLWNEQSVAKRWMEAALSTSTHALLTFEDEQKLHFDATANETMLRTLALGPGEVVIKMGKDGCLVQSDSPAGSQAIPAETVTPVDTTAAGDSFNGAYLAARLQGKNTVEAARAGNRLAAKVVMYPGAIVDNAA